MYGKLFLPQRHLPYRLHVVCFGDLQFVFEVKFVKHFPISRPCNHRNDGGTSICDVTVLCVEHQSISLTGGYHDSDRDVRMIRQGCISEEIECPRIEAPGASAAHLVQRRTQIPTCVVFHCETAFRRCFTVLFRTGWPGWHVGPVEQEQPTRRPPVSHANDQCTRPIGVDVWTRARVAATCGTLCPVLTHLNGCRIWIAHLRLVVIASCQKRSRCSRPRSNRARRGPK